MKAQRLMTGELSIGEPNGKGLLEFYSGQKIECFWEGGDPIGNAIGPCPK